MVILDAEEMMEILELIALAERIGCFFDEDSKKIAKSIERKIEKELNLRNKKKGGNRCGLGQF